jgi:PAS domain S-box-containing protein
MASERKTQMNDTVLLIEDDVRLISQIQSVFQDLCIEAQCCVSGQTALAWLARHRPVLIILDNSLPDSTGLELVQRIEREIPDGMPPYILTADSDDGRLSRDAMKLGAAACLVKDELFLNELPATLMRMRQAIEAKRCLERVETELRDSELRYRALFQHAPVAIWQEDFSGVKEHLDALRSSGVTDFRKYFKEHPEDVKHCASLVRMIDVNLEALKLLGIESTADWPMDLPQIFNEETWPVFSEELVVLANGGAAFQSDVSITLPNKEPRILSMKLTVAPECASTLGQIILSFSDVTEERNQKAELRVSERTLTAFMNAIPESAFLIDREYTVLACNSTFAERLGRIPAEIPGLNMRDILPPPIYTARIAQLDEVFRTGQAAGFQDMRQDRYMKHYLYPVMGADGDIHAVAGLGMDITEQMRTSNELNEAATRYRIVADNTFDWEFWLSPAGQFAYVSPSCQRVTGYSAAEFMADVDLFFRIIHPDDQERLHKHSLHVLQAMCPDEKQSEYRIIDKSGSVHWIGHICQPVFNDQGVFLGIRGSNRDITDRKKVQEESDLQYARSKAIIESSERAIFSIDRNYCYTAFNTSHAQDMKALFGVDIEIGANILDYHLNLADRADALSNFDWALAGESIRVEHETGDEVFSRRYYEIIHNPIRDTNGNVVGVAVYAKDLTEFRRAQQALEEKDVRLAKLASQMPGMLYQFMMKPDGTFCVPFATEAIRNIFGCTPQQVAEDFTPIANAIHPDDLDRIVRSIMQSAASVTLWQEEYRVQLPGKPLHWLWGSSIPEKLPDGSIIWHGYNVDITERKTMEESLRLGNERFELAQQAAKEGIWDWNVETGAIEWTPQMYEMFGIDPSLTTGLFAAWENVLHRDDAKVAPALIEVALKNHTYLDSEYRIVLPTGETRWISSLGRGEYDAQGQPNRMIGVCIDITERKRAEESLRASEHRLTQIFETNAAVKLIIDPEDGSILQANQAAAEFYGYPLKDLLEKSIQDINCLSPEEIKAEMTRAKSEDRLHFFFKHRLASGEIRDVEVYSGPFQTDGKILLHSIVVDVTERKRAEEALRESEHRLHQVFNTNAAVKLIIDPGNGRILQANSAAVQFYGYPADEFAEKTIFDLSCLPPDTIRAEMARRAAEDNRYGTFRHRLASGEVRDVEVYSSNFQSGGQTLLHSIVFDITERRRAEEALRAREEQYRALFDSMLEGCAYCQMIYDENGEPQDWVYLDANRSFGRLTGLTDVIGRRVTDVIPSIKESNPELFRIYGNVARTGQSTSFEIFFKPLGLWLEVNVVCPNSGHFLAVFENVSARMLAVEALRESELRFKQVSENAEEWIWEVDADGLYLYSSAIVEKILGYTPSELIGKRHFYELFAPEVRDKLTAAAMNGIQRRESFHHMINVNVHKDGHEVIMETNAVPILNEHGELLGYRGTDQDITARQKATAALMESEERFRMVSNLAPVGIYRTDSQGICVYVNDHWCEMAGLTYEEAMGDGWHKALHPDDRSKVASAWQRMVDSEGHWGLEYRFQTPEGKITWLYGYAAPMRDPDGKIFGYVGCNADITQRKQAEDALHASEDRLREIIENQGEGIGIIGGDEAFLFANPAADEIFGVPRGTLIGRDMVEFLSEREFDKIKAESEKRKKGEKGNYELEIRRPNGETRNLLVTATPRRNKVGHVIGTFGIFRDITERKRGELALQISEDRYRELYEQSPLGYQSLDSEGRFITVNQAWLDTLGYRAEEVIGRWFGDFVAPHLVDAFRERFPHFKDAGKTHTSFVMKRRDGSLTTMEFDGRIGYDHNGEFKQTHCILQDVTERKLAEEKLRASEERFRRIFEQGPLGMVITNPPHHRFVAVNSAFCEFLGYTESELLARSFPDVTYPEHLEADVLAITQLYQGERSLYSTEKRYVRKDGAIVWGHVTVTIVHDSDGKVSATLAMIEDITPRKQTEERLKASEAQLMASQRMEAIGRLAGGVAHDFNNLLTVISGHSEITLRQLSETDPLRADIEEIMKTSQRAGNLTRQLLAFSRRQPVSPVVLDLNGTVANLLRMLKRIIGENITLETNYQPGLWNVKADPGMIEQVIVNLTVNARDAMPDGGVLSIETLNMVIEEEIIHGHEVILTGRYALMSITDTGIGMRPEVQARIFEPFFTTKPIGVGTGLGLATVFGIVKQSGGNIVVDSREGVGTTFNIYLPAVADEAPRSDSHVEQERQLRGEEKILLVDDNSAVHKLLARVLAQYGYWVTTASSAEEALSICDTMPQPVDILVSDVVLPKMNGMNLAMAIRDRWPSVKILLMSGYTADVIPNDIAEHGFTLLQKPFGPMHLVSRVRDLIDADER